MMKIKKWMPSGWWIIVDNTLGKWRYRAGADGIGETTSVEKYVSERQASAQAKEHLRRSAAPQGRPKAAVVDGGVHAGVRF